MKINSTYISNGIISIKKSLSAVTCYIRVTVGKEINLSDIFWIAAEYNNELPYAVKENMVIPIFIMNSSGVPAGLGLAILNETQMYIISNVKLNVNYFIRGSATFLL